MENTVHNPQLPAQPDTRPVDVSLNELLNAAHEPAPANHAAAINPAIGNFLKKLPVLSEVQTEKRGTFPPEISPKSPGTLAENTLQPITDIPDGKVINKELEWWTADRLKRAGMAAAGLALHSLFAVEHMSDPAIRESERPVVMVVRPVEATYASQDIYDGKVVINAAPQQSMSGSPATAEKTDDKARHQHQEVVRREAPEGDFGDLAEDYRKKHGEAELLRGSGATL